MISDNYDAIIRGQLNDTLHGTSFQDIGKLYEGKVRDNYTKDGHRIIIATDRISSFDRVITTVPFKGQMLNQISSFWFEKTKEIAPNHLIDVPDPNVSVVKECETIPIEMIVRAYVTGSMWRDYRKGKTTSGIELPKGMQKNQELDDLILTPSTKAKTGHDIYISREDIFGMGTIDFKTYEQMEELSLKLFRFGQKHCHRNGLILVDTKYEFGLVNGKLTVIDEIHTQDSSRFWIADTYEERFDKGEDPEILDKEIFRGWLMENYLDIFPDIRPDQEVPEIPDDIRVEVCQRYMKSYKMITGSEFKPKTENIVTRISDNLKKNGYL